MKEAKMFRFSNMKYYEQNAYSNLNRIQYRSDYQ